MVLRRQGGAVGGGLLGLLLIVAIGVFGWHVYAVSVIRADIEKRFPPDRTHAEISIQTFTDVVTLHFDKPPELSRSDNPLGALGAAIGSVLGGALAKAIEPTIERDLNTRARELFDLYAMMLPYRVKVIVAEPANGEET